MRRAFGLLVRKERWDSHCVASLSSFWRRASAALAWQRVLIRSGNYTACLDRNHGGGGCSRPLTVQQLANRYVAKDYRKVIV